MRILVVDNYDSFVFNLVQYLGQLGVQAEVWRNDDARLSDPSDGQATATQFDGVLLSPGPGTPERAGASISLVRACAATNTPLLGVCLGHQAIGVAFGATVDRAPELLHGKTSSVFHTNAGVLQGLPDPFTATRYHSLTILPESLPCGPGGHRAHPQRGDHGGASHRPADPRCAIPPGVDPDRGRASDAGQLARLLRVGTRRNVGPQAGKRGPRRGPAALSGSRGY